MKATALYKTDFHHSYNSRELIGIFTNERKYIKEVKRMIEEDIKTDSGNRNYQEEKDYINWNIDSHFHYYLVNLFYLLEKNLCLCFDNHKLWM